jgi:SAM-dependent methyltransferase
MLSEIPSAGTVDHELEKRNQVEERFHDEKTRQRGQPASRMDFYDAGVNEEHSRILFEVVGDLHGKRVLDFGCGPGQTSRDCASRGATRVDGFDISNENVLLARKNAARDGLDNRVFFRHMAAESIDYADGSFDVVIGKAILHHTDLRRTSWQVHRVLRPGGTAYFLEPLAHNPFLNLFRLLTPWRRTPTERPLLIEDLNLFCPYFDSIECRGFYLLPILANVLLLLTGRRSLYAKTMRVLFRWEKPLLMRFPFLQKYCWTALLIFRKGPAGTKVVTTAS